MNNQFDTHRTFQTATEWEFVYFQTKIQNRNEYTINVIGKAKRINLSKLYESALNFDALFGFSVASDSTSVTILLFNVATIHAYSRMAIN